jgi:hypothetical protein
MSSGSKITGEGKVTTFKWFDREASSGPLSPRVSYLFKHLNTEKINAIMNRMNRGEITGDEMIKLLEEVRSIAFLFQISVRRLSILSI